MDMAILTQAGLEFLLRWVHFLAGVTWIGLLYYFNFVQGEWFKEIEPAVKSAAVQKLVPRALWWFRWAAMLTFLSGLAILLMRGFVMSIDMAFGFWLGTLMFLNVWLVIWPNQKTVIASAVQVAGGGQALPNAADAATRAALASRHNVLFSIPMLFFMGASTHLPHGLVSEASALQLGVFFLSLLALEANALKGKLGPLVTVKGVIGLGFAYALVLYLVVELL
jgi:uncharacterized membrane protein